MSFTLHSVCTQKNPGGAQINSLGGPCTLSATLNVPNKITFEKLPRTFQIYSGRPERPFPAHKPFCLHKLPYSLSPRRGPLLPVPDLCVEQSSYRNSSWVADRRLGSDSCWFFPLRVRRKRDAATFKEPRNTLQFCLLPLSLISIHSSKRTVLSSRVGVFQPQDY